MNAGQALNPLLGRRSFLAGAGLLTTGGARAQPGRKKLAVVTTEWRDRSHSWHMAERFMAGYPFRGAWRRPDMDVVSAYIDQFPENDLGRARAKEHGFEIYPSIAAALRRGGGRLAVDGVLLIGEHGRYPTNELGQRLYPRYEFFRQIAEVFRADGRSVPVFNDKHLSWKWEWALEMVETSRKLGFPFVAGSSLPHTWRMPAVDLPYGAGVREALGVAFGGVDSYDFHALEMIQCMLERRKGGETGVRAVTGLRGPAVWTAMAAGSWEKGGWDPRLFEACLSRTQTLAQAPAYSHRYPSEARIREWVRDPVAYRLEYGDGTRATMLLLNGLVSDFTFAATLAGRREPLSTLFYLPPNPNVVYSAALMARAEEMFRTGRAPYPIERTLLTSGVLATAIGSMKAEKRLDTPHLGIRYRAPRESLFWQD